MEMHKVPQHVGPIIRHACDCELVVCQMHFIAAIPIMCVNCGKHYVSVFYGLGHDGLWEPVLETPVSALGGVDVGVSAVEWIEIEPEGCECGAWSRLVGGA